MHRLLLIAIVFASGAREQIAFAAAPPKQTPDRQNFTVDGRPAFMIAPTKKLGGATPWLLYAPTLGRGLPGGAEDWMFHQFLDAGIAIAGVDVGESYGSPKGRATYNALHKQLTEDRGFAQKACLLARSRGGLMLYCWAAVGTWDHVHRTRLQFSFWPAFRHQIVYGRIRRNGPITTLPRKDCYDLQGFAILPANAQTSFAT